jgi:hypothetical protein
MDCTEPDRLDIRFTRKSQARGRYHCWAKVLAPDGTVLDLGDPWPGSRWPKAVLIPLAQSALARHAGDLEAAAHFDAEAIEAQRGILIRKASAAISGSV